MSLATKNPTTSTRGVCVCGRRFNHACGYQVCSTCRLQHGTVSLAAADDRTARMAALYRQGSTLHAIGNEVGLSAERVRQLLNAHGISSRDGGKAVAARRAAVDAATKDDRRCMARWGHSRAAHRALLAIGREMVAAGGGAYTTPMRAFRSQRSSARWRGIAWRLTLAEWWAVWVESGQWDMRGRGHGNYVMSRRGDVGAYAVGNVFIQQADLNNSISPHKKSEFPIGVGIAKWSRGGGPIYYAQKMLNGKVRYLGSYPTIEAASEAYRNAKSA